MCVCVCGQGDLQVPTLEVSVVQTGHCFTSIEKINYTSKLATSRYCSRSHVRSARVVKKVKIKQHFNSFQAFLPEITPQFAGSMKFRQDNNVFLLRQTRAVC